MRNLMGISTRRTTWSQRLSLILAGRSPGGRVNFIFHVKHVTQLSRANREVLRREQAPATIEPPSIVCAVHAGMILLHLQSFG